MAASGAIEHMVRVGGRRLRLTNLEKVLYPATGTTKGEVIDYYTRIAPLLLPHVNGRPVTRKRWPDGVGTQEHPLDPFFAKHLEPGAPDWVARRPIEHSTGAKDYPLVADVATLVYLAQVASLELHVPQWRFTPDGEHGKPDRQPEHDFTRRNHQTHLRSSRRSFTLAGGFEDRLEGRG